MNIEHVPLAEIRPYERNPRAIPPEAVEAVARSIEEFGWRQPIVLDADGVIIAGHVRYRAALRLGLDTAPCHTAAGLDPGQVAAYRIADNKTAELAEWDPGLLEGELGEMDRDLMAGIGFTEGELDNLLLDADQFSDDPIADFQRLNPGIKTERHQGKADGYPYRVSIFIAEGMLEEATKAIGELAGDPQFRLDTTRKTVWLPRRTMKPRARE